MRVHDIRYYSSSTTTAISRRIVDEFINYNAAISINFASQELISQFHADLIEPHQKKKKRNLETIISFIVQLVRLQSKRYPLISEKQIRITNRSGPGKWPREPVILSAKLHSGDRETESRERGSALCAVSLHAGNSTRNSASKIERWKGDAIVARVQSVHSFLFLSPPPPYVSSVKWMRVGEQRRPEGCLISLSALL